MPPVKRVNVQAWRARVVIVKDVGEEVGLILSQQKQLKRLVLLPLLFLSVVDAVEKLSIIAHQEIKFGLGSRMTERVDLPTYFVDESKLVKQKLMTIC